MLRTLKVSDSKGGTGQQRCNCDLSAPRGSSWPEFEVTVAATSNGKKMYALIFVKNKWCSLLMSQISVCYAKLALLDWSRDSSNFIVVQLVCYVCQYIISKSANTYRQYWFDQLFALLCYKMALLLPIPVTFYPSHCIFFAQLWIQNCLIFKTDHFCVVVGKDICINFYYNISYKCL